MELKQRRRITGHPYVSQSLASANRHTSRSALMAPLCRNVRFATELVIIVTLLANRSGWLPGRGRSLVIAWTHMQHVCRNKRRRSNCCRWLIYSKYMRLVDDKEI